MHDYLTGPLFLVETTDCFFIFTGQCMLSSIDNGITVYISGPYACLAGHSGTVVGKLEGERPGICRLDDYIEKDRNRGIYFTQDWVSMPGVLPVASGGIHARMAHAGSPLTEIFGDDSVLQFGGRRCAPRFIPEVEAYQRSLEGNRRLSLL